MELKIFTNQKMEDVKLVGTLTWNEIFDKAMAVDITVEEKRRTELVMEVMENRKVNHRDRLYLALNIIRLDKNYDNSLGRRISKEEYWENDISKPIKGVFIKTNFRSIEIYERINKGWDQ
ncbi:hypothetical protein [Inconstantimicrobium mannanitabidum]|uniref:Uncharacterized protein n=1 Tax=Inconstantimicrobium mannanitabidum TaxID=1604901 RepID=A0ACB5R9U5_9CLOT|nr:hypothetical protein [Clostridium sp. TW13]GKX65811.1 hypothetical protein rsdtw13_10690 [Clostridium sp. TW13]